jgi:uncharacterized repeat protein (TIGR01451 family)
MQLYAAWAAGGIVLTGILMGTAPKAIAQVPPKFTDPANYPAAWPLDNAWKPYKINGGVLRDDSGDGTNGGTSPQGSSNISPCLDKTSSTYFVRDTNNLYFRICLANDPYQSNNGPFDSSTTWSILIDTTGDGYRDFVVTVDGKGGSGDQAPDNLYVLYKNDRRQDFLNADVDFGSGSAVLWAQDSAKGTTANTTDANETSWDVSSGGANSTYTQDFKRTRITKNSASNSSTYFLDVQVPLSAFDAGSGGPKITSTSSLALAFATANSNTNPIQKDFTAVGNFTVDPSKPVPFGDAIGANNETYDQPSIPAIGVGGTACSARTLTAQVQDSIIYNGTNFVSSVNTLKFYYQRDADGNGLPDYTASWTEIGNGTILDSTNQSLWTFSNWNTSGLLTGTYFIKAVATDGGADGNSSTTTDNNTTDSTDAVDGTGNNNTGGDTFNPGTLQSVPIAPLFASFSNTCGVSGTDYSDAPTSGTAPNGTGTNNYGNATHTFLSTLKLGAAIDSETASIANATASGDGTDDDGITLPNLSTGATSYSIPAANIIATGTGTLHAWIDFNKNGTFDTGEYKSVAVNSNTPAGALSWSGITIGAVGNTFARFRLTSDSSVTSATPSGNASNGEVEDYQVSIVKQTINNTPSATSCSVLGGTLSGNNLFTPLDNGTFGFENGTPNQSPATNPYPGIVSGGRYNYFYSNTFTHGDYSYVANPVTPRNSFQHPGITDPVYGVTGRFFASDPNTSTPTLTTTLTGLTPNQFYEYSFWAANSEPNGNPNNVDVLINGQKIYGTGPLPAITTALEWKKHTVSFTNGSSTSITIDLKSTQTGNSGNDFYLDNIELRGCNFIVDYGDAPPSYGDAIHTTIPTTPKVYLGTAAPDGETSTPLGGDNGAGADGDDANQSSDDEDAFTSLNNVPATGTYALNNIPVKNISGGDVTLHAWIDFNRDGKFAAGEYKSTTVANNATTANLIWTVPSGAVAGNTYARFRISPNALITDNVNTTDIDERSKDAVINGEVEDYQVAISAPVGSNPNVLLVKRITAINGNTTNGNISLNSYDPEIDTSNLSYPYDKNVIQSGVTPPSSTNWPSTTGAATSTFLLGARNGGTSKPNDVIEYTIYFLSTGTSAAKNVTICDRLPANHVLIPDAFNNLTAAPNTTPASSTGDRGIAVFQGSTTKPDTIYGYTNVGDGDAAQYYPPGSTLPSACTQPALAEDNGAVVVTLGDLPNATNPGTPKESYGFLRFRTRLK